MKYLFLIVFLNSCYPVQDNWRNARVQKQQQSKIKEIECRITYYHPYQDKWGSQVACPKTKRAQKGVTVAAHPDFKFGQKIFIPRLKDVVGDGFFIVQDRGGAVTKKTASSGDAYVFDVFVNNQKELSTYSRKLPQYMKVFIKQ